MKLVATLAFAVALGAFGLAQAQTTPTADPAAHENAALKAPHAMQAGGLAKGHNSFTKGQARKHIQKAGYTDVTGLMKDKSGLWQGQAMKDGKSVNVAMDFKGAVTSN